MSLRVFIPCDAGAVAVGADEVTGAMERAARRRNVALEIVRTGSRGLYWLEPMVEVATAAGRVAYGPVTPDDVPSLIDAMLGNGTHPLNQGAADDIPWLKRQTRLTFARSGVVDPRSLDDYRLHSGCRGLAQAIALGPEATIETVFQSGLRGRGGAGFPTGIKWRTVAQVKAPQKYIVCNADEGDSGTFADRMIMEGDPLVLVEGMAIAGIALVAASLFLRGRGRVIAGVLGAVLAVSKLWWMPFALWQQFDDGQVFGYTLKYFPQYWPVASLIVGVIALVGLASAIVRRP